MECSAKDNYNTTELFKTLLSLSKIMPTENSDSNGGSGFKRRSSAYVSATSKGKLPNLNIHTTIYTYFWGLYLICNFCG